MIMKRFFAITITALLFTACGVSAQTPEQKAAETAKITNAILDCDFEIAITFVHPQQGPSISTNNEYSFVMKDGEVTTRLPFRGSASSMMPYQSDLSIVFDHQPVTVTKDTSKAAKGKYTLSFEAKCEEDIWRVQIQLFDNGQAYITCECPSRSIMRYDGEMIFK